MRPTSPHRPQAPVGRSPLPQCQQVKFHRGLLQHLSQSNPRSRLHLTVQPPSGRSREGSTVAGGSFWHDSVHGIADALRHFALSHFERRMRPVKHLPVPILALGQNPSVQCPARSGYLPLEKSRTFRPQLPSVPKPGMADAQNSRLLPVPDLDSPFIQARYADVGMRRQQIDIDEIFSPSCMVRAACWCRTWSMSPGVWIVVPAAFHRASRRRFPGPIHRHCRCRSARPLDADTPWSLLSSASPTRTPQAVAAVVPGLGALQLVNHREIAPLAPEDIAPPVQRPLYPAASVCTKPRVALSLL